MSSVETATLKPVRVPQRSSRQAGQVAASGTPVSGSLAGLYSSGMLPQGKRQGEVLLIARRCQAQASDPPALTWSALKYGFESRAALVRIPLGVQEVCFIDLVLSNPREG